MWALYSNFYGTSISQSLPDNGWAGEHHTQTEWCKSNSSLRRRRTTCYQLKQTLVFIVIKSENNDNMANADIKLCPQSGAGPWCVSLHPPCSACVIGSNNGKTQCHPWNWKCTMLAEENWVTTRGNMHGNYVKFVYVVVRYADAQTDRQTDMLITILTPLLGME